MKTLLYFLNQKKCMEIKGEVPEGEYIIPIGVADVKRKGTTCNYCYFRKIIKVAEEVAEILAKENLESRLLI